MSEPFYEPEGLYKGAVKDPDTARGLADLEKPARDREAELKRVAETGLTQEQRDNTEIMNGLEEKYPKAFEVKIDDKGRKSLMIDVKSLNLTQALGVCKLVISQEGVAGIGSSYPGLTAEDLNITNFIDSVVDKRPDFEAKNGFAGFESVKILSTSGNKKVGTPGVPIRLIDLSNDLNQRNLKSVFVEGQTYATNSELHQETFKEKATPKSIISNL